jgi:hypothetical protein
MKARFNPLKRIKAWFLRQKKRQPQETRHMTRKRISKCDPFIRHQYAKVNKSFVQLDHIISRKLRINRSENLRSLRCRCDLFENDHRHRKIIIKSLKNGVLCPNWSAELRIPK